MAPTITILPKNLQKRGQKPLQRNLQQMSRERNRHLPFVSAKKIGSFLWKR